MCYCIFCLKGLVGVKSSFFVTYIETIGKILKILASLVSLSFKDTYPVIQKVSLSLYRRGFDERMDRRL